MSHILIDLDGVVFDWGTAYGKGLAEYGINAAMIPRHAEQRSFDLFAGRTKTQIAIIRCVMNDMDYSKLEPIKGAIMAVESMLEDGHTVQFCSSPWVGNPNCEEQKRASITEHFGPTLADAAIISHDKTVAVGDWLVDDKPKITGANPTPTWRQIIFDQPYNRGVSGYRLYNWGDWKNEEWHK